ncbi:hypothetical protein GUITHDRAFT_74535, partial [Guillardia theta CCMP2712]
MWRERTGVKFPRVAVLIPVTSHGFRWKGIEEVPLIRFCLPSISQTAELGYDYAVYMGYDVGDLFFDNQQVLQQIKVHFETQIRNPNLQRGVEMQLAVLGFENLLKKPGPVFNFLSSSAALDGADYIYRINDDTEFRTAWTSSYIRTLLSFKPPNVGVVGPTCREGNERILTHDFVHVTHLHIFGVHYPPVLMDWWMDDWISSVYPAENFRKLRTVLVTHH